MAKLKNLQHEKFCHCYLVHFNGARAAREAGYAESSAKVRAVELLKREDIQARLCELADEATGSIDVTRDRIVAEAAAVAFSDVRNVVEWGPAGVTLRLSSELAEAAAVAVSQVKEGKHGVELKLHDKMKALELLAKIQGLFKEDGATIINQFMIEIPKPLSPEEWQERYGKKETPA